MAASQNSKLTQKSNQTPTSNKPAENSDYHIKLLELAEQVAHFGSWEWDITQPRAVWSPELFRIFGIAPKAEGLTLQEYRSFIHPDDLEEITKKMQASIAEPSLNQKSEIDYRIIRRDGSVRIIHSQSSKHQSLCFDARVCLDDFFSTHYYSFI